MTNSIILMMFGVLIYVLGLMSGWNMRSSVKEDELSRYKVITERVEQLRWKIIEVLEKVDK